MASENASTPRWPKRYILLWLLLAVLVGWWRGFRTGRLQTQPQLPTITLFRPSAS